MTTLSKTDAEALIDRLASKELRRGLYVRCKPFDDEGTVIYKEKTLWYVEVIKSKHDVELPHVSALREQDIEPIGHPILLNSILLKSADKTQDWDAKLIELWRKCGLEKSLQEIAQLEDENMLNLFDFLATL